MPLTPADVHNVTFSKPPIGKRGYKEDEVDVFLDLVGAELARLIEINKHLREEIDRLRPVTAPLRTPMRELSSSGGNRTVHAVPLLDLAQETADRLIREAGAGADGMLRKALSTSEHLLSNARTKADGMVNEARARAETMLNDARTRAETLDRQSRENAASLERDSIRQHTEIVGGIAREKIALEQKIGELRALDREYRTQLQTDLNSQIRKLDERGAVVPADPMCTQQGFVAHHLIPSVRTTGAGSSQPVQISVGNGSPDRRAMEEPGAIRTRWQPAV